MKCIYTNKAETDLETIADYIALDNPQRALSFIDEIRQRCTLICTAPEGGIIMLHILHGATNWQVIE